MIELSDSHRDALKWFQTNTGNVISWPDPLPDGQLLAAKAKGIYKPAGWSHALSVRIIPSGGYPDEEPKDIGNGRWRFQYHQEERRNGGDPQTFATNLGLEQCMRDGVPVGILRQTKTSPNPTYEVSGLGMVTNWQGSFFTIEGPADIDQSKTESDTSQQQPTSTEDARDRTMREIFQRRGQRKFRANLLRAYERRCAISGCSVEAVLEAAHIVPYLGEHTNVITNGLLLRSDLHTLFDFNLVRIDAATLTVIVDPSLTGSEYDQFDGKSLRKPKLGHESPNPENFRLRDEMLTEDRTMS